MKRGTAISIILGLALGSVAGLAEVEAHTDWLDDPIIAEAAEWEPIPDTAVSMSYGADPERTHDIVTRIWEIDGEYQNDTDIPDDIEEAALIYGEMFGICPELLEAICSRETGGTYRTDLVGDKGQSLGCMQINTTQQAERIAAYGLTAEEMYKPDCAMLVAASFLSELVDRYEDIGEVLYRYNGAITDLKEYHKTGQLNEYVAYVLQLSEELEEKHGKRR